MKKPKCSDRECRKKAKFKCSGCDGKVFCRKHMKSHLYIKMVAPDQYGDYQVKL